MAAEGVHRMPAFMCMCGYVADAYGSIDPDHSARPAEIGDLCLCLNCGAPHTFVDGTWSRMGSVEIEALEPEERRWLAEMEYRRSQVIREDLSKGRGGRA